MRRAARWCHTLRWKALPPDYNRTYRLHANGFELAVLPSVFHPKWHFTSTYFAETCHLAIPSGAHVVEIGTGTGVVALSAGHHARSVVAVDINPAAAQCARLNVLSNGMAGKVEVYEGDMFAPLGGGRFDVILCNPPYFRGAARSDVDQAYMAGAELEWIARLGMEAHEHINPGGALACVFGDAADVPALVALIEAQGWSGEVVDRRNLVLEELSVWRFKPRM